MLHDLHNNMAARFGPYTYRRIVQLEISVGYTYKGRLGIGRPTQGTFRLLVAPLSYTLPAEDMTTWSCRWM